MDADGARALARRIQEGRGTPALPGRPELKSQEPATRARYGVRIYMTERCPVFDGAHSAVLVRRVCKTLVDGDWVVSVLHEELVDA